MKIIPVSHLTSISAGHPATAAVGTGISVIFFLELPHIIMGIREFTNYTIDCWQQGGYIEENNDHFTAFFRDMFKPAKV
jgi:hypothetical protein